MTSAEIKTTDDVRRLVESRGLSHVKVGVFDIDGILRGKYLSREKLYSALDSGFGFCDVVLGWDSHDQLYDNVTYTGWHTGYPDAPVRLLPQTCRNLTMEDDGLFILGEFDKQAEAICPRGTLRRVLDKAADMGFLAKAGFEYEFFVFNETRESIRTKNYRDLTPLAPGFFGYSVLRNSVDSDFYRGLLALCEDMDFPIEGLHEETGPGVLEAAISVDDGLEAADKAALFKTFAKIYAQRQGKLATFMAKWSPDWPGAGGHVHMSLTDLEGKPVFYEAAEAYTMSKVQQQFVAGQVALLPEFLAMAAPTVNSFSRLIPGFWAPTASAWSVDNRTCALRVIQGSSKSQRTEFRVGAADANPYLVLAAALAAGLYGIEHEMELEPPVMGNAYEQTQPEHRQLPRTLWDAAQRIKGSEAARQWLGDAFVDHFAASREWEEREFRKHITDWELARYFEII